MKKVLLIVSVASLPAILYFLIYFKQTSDNPIDKLNKENLMEAQQNSSDKQTEKLLVELNENHDRSHVTRNENLSNEATSNNLIEKDEQTRSQNRDKEKEHKLYSSNSKKTSDKKGVGKMPKEFILNTLSVHAYDIQDNSLTDEWGVVLKQDQLPPDLQDADGYTITIEDKSYELTQNVFSENIYNGGVPNGVFSKKKVELGIIKKK